MKNAPPLASGTPPICSTNTLVNRSHPTIITITSTTATTTTIVESIGIIHCSCGNDTGNGEWCWCIGLQEQIQLRSSRSRLKNRYVPSTRIAVFDFSEARKALKEGR
jgi:hypothetical protein